MTDSPGPCRLKIGLDFDDTLMHTREALVALLNKIHNTNIRAEDCTDYYLSHPWSLTEEKFAAMFNQHEEQIHTQPPLEGLLETLQHWQVQFRATFVVITGRPECWKASARRWLDHHGICVNDIHCAHGNGEKAIIAQQQKVDLFIDDHATFAREIADTGIPVLLIDRPYNRHLTHKNVTRVKDWQQIRRVVDETFDRSKLTV